MLSSRRSAAGRQRECRDRSPPRQVGRWSLITAATAHHDSEGDPDTRSLRSLLRDDREGSVLRAARSRGMRISTSPYPTENRYTVRDVYSAPGRRMVDGKPGWLGESGKCWVSSASPERRAYGRPSLPGTPVRKLPL